MLEELLIRDLGVLEEVALRPSDGLTVVTGETGAGKTMVVSALELLRGVRADTDRVRAGATTALVEGRVRPPPPGAAAWVDDGDDELVASREVGADRSRARLGGRLAPASALAAVVGEVVEVHGQHDTAQLVQPAVQRELLDRSGGEGLLALRGRYRDAYDRWRAGGAELAELRGDARERAREADRLRFELGEIDAVAPVPGEEADLAAEAARLEHAEALRDAAAAAASALTADGGGRDATGVAVAALRAAAGVDPALDELRARAESVLAEVQDLGLELASYAQDVDLDPSRLEDVRARRHALGALVRKYGPGLDGVLAFADEARSRLAALEGGDDRAATLERELDALGAAVRDLGEELRRARQEAGQRLAAAVGRHLADLAMRGARLDVEVLADEPHTAGADRIAFLLAANAGDPARPLGRVASGGERSRIALALRLALAGADPTTVVVFDEVDEGVGGEVALAVGAKLASLARTRQVLCVTHLAQLAAFADVQVVVEKVERHGRTAATVRAVDGDARLRELARLLSGTPQSAAAAEHAAELLALAASRRDVAAAGSTPP